MKGETIQTGNIINYAPQHKNKKIANEIFPQSA